MMKKELRRVLAEGYYSKKRKMHLITFKPVINMNDGFFSHFSLQLLGIQHQKISW